MKFITFGFLISMTSISTLDASMLECQKDLSSSELPKPTPYEFKKNKKRACSCPSW